MSERIKMVLFTTKYEKKQPKVFTQCTQQAKVHTHPYVIMLYLFMHVLYYFFFFSEKDRSYINWISRVSVTSPEPMKWTARSLDLTTCGNSLWGYIKDNVSKQRYHSYNELKAECYYGIWNNNPCWLRKMFHRTWRRIILCSKNEGSTQTH